MKALSQTKQFEKDLKRVLKRGKDLDKLKTVVSFLAQGQELDPKYRVHPLQGNWKDSRDCHIEPDWLLVYTTDTEFLRLERTGSHSDLFR